MSNLSSLQLAGLLRSRKEDIIRRWTLRVLEDPSIPEANRLSEPDVRDHIPRLIDRIASCLEPIERGGESGVALSASEGSAHGRQRFAKEYRLTEALSEMAHFRATILELCAEEGGTPDVDASRCLHAAIDQSIVSASDEMEKAAVAQVREQAAFRERFIGVLGHDLRNPLQAIKSAASLLGRDDLTDPPSRLAGRIVASADRMGQMIADLLEVTRARLGGGVPLEREPADLSAIVRQAIGELEIARPGRTVQLDVHGDVCGEFDPGRLARVISNLVSNALDYSPPGTPARVCLRGEVAHVLVIVNNEGSTIAPEVMARLFEPFVQGSQGGRVAQGQGLGLGLFIAREIVQAHGGSIDVASTPEEGTTFTVRVPRSA